jgi:hypothetical protein
MVKFLGMSGDRRTIGLGLSRENCQRLLNGQPIRVAVDAPLPAGLGLTDLPLDIVLIGGETEASIGAEIERAAGVAPRKLQ